MKPEFYIGTSGWSYDHWKGNFYPDKLPQKKRLSFYSQIFDTVEVNMSFYRYPREHVVAGWGESTPANFVFTFKAPRIITHIRRLAGIEGQLYRLYDLLDLPGSRGRGILFQMPPSFHLSPSSLKRVEGLLDILDDRYDHAIEFRDRAWWCKDVYDLLRNRCAFCSVNGLDMPRDIISTCDIMYMRFHGGHYNLRYSDGELEKYAEEICSIALERKIRKLYVYFNNDYNGYAVINARYIREIIAARFGIDLKQ